MDRDRIFYELKNLAVVKVHSLCYEYRKNVIGWVEGQNYKLDKEIFQLAVMSADGQRARLISDIVQGSDKIFCKGCIGSNLIDCKMLEDCVVEIYETPKKPLIKQKHFYALCNSQIENNTINSSQAVLVKLEERPTENTKFSLAFLKSNNDRFVLSQIQQLNRKVEKRIVSLEF